MQTHGSPSPLCSRLPAACTCVSHVVRLLHPEHPTLSSHRHCHTPVVCFMRGCVASTLPVPTRNRAVIGELLCQKPNSAGSRTRCAADMTTHAQHACFTTTTHEPTHQHCTVACCCPNHAHHSDKSCSVMWPLTASAAAYGCRNSCASWLLSARHQARRQHQPSLHGQHNACKNLQPVMHPVCGWHVPAASAAAQAWFPGLAASPNSTSCKTCSSTTDDPAEAASGGAASEG